MKPAPFNLLLEAASRDNILILTTNCSTSCVFCSHLQNPGDVEAYYVDELDKNQIETLIEFLDGRRKIVIGESATRICEGEPFLREDLIDILYSVRQKHGNTLVQITTSGIHLNEAVLSELKGLGNIELNISLNSCSMQGREKLYRGKAHMSAVEAVKLLEGYDIAFSGSIVAMPHLLGWEDIRESILFLNEYNASTIRVFMPGFTRFTKGILPPEDIGSRLSRFVSEIRGSIDVPLIMEPSGVEDLDAVIEGVIKVSAAWSAGLSKGDRIMEVNGEKTASRVDAYYKILKSRNPRLQVLRDGKTLEVEINKQAKAASGLVFNYDIHPDEINAIEKGILRNSGSRCLLLTSELAYPILTACIEQSASVRIEAARNGYFGGNIACAGLLTIRDVEAHLSSMEAQTDVVLLPSIMFDSSGRDLLGRHFKEIEEGLGIKAEVI
jgi:NifB/MoaA-like Fe-S oxidoreductase